MITAIKAPDRKAPRFRETTISLLNKYILSSFREKHPEYSAVSNDQLKKIIETFNGFLWQTVINNRDGIELPEGLGNVFVGSCKTPRKENIDHNKSTKHGVKVINRNLATDGYLAKIFYTNHEARYKFRFRKLWRFKGVRQFTRKVSVTYKDEWPKYIVVEDFQRISNLVRKHKRNAMHEKLIAQDVVPQTYNEFDMD